MQGNNGGILLTSPHVKVTWNSLATEQGGRHWRRSTREIRGVFSVGIEVDGFPSR